MEHTLMQKIISKVKILFWPSILRNVVCLFLLLLLPLYGMSLLIVERGSRVMKQGIIENNRSQILSGLLILENDMDNIRGIQSELLENEDLNALAFFSAELKPYDITLRRRALMDRLRGIESGSLYIKDVSAYIFGSNIRVSSQNYVSALTSEDLQRINGIWEKRDARLTVWQSGLYMGLFFPRYNSVTSYGQFCVMIEFDTDAVDRYINQNQIYKNGRSVLAFSSGDLLIGGDSRGETARFVADTVLNAPDSFGNGSVSIPYEDSRLMVVYQYSPALGALMFHFTSESDAFKPLTFYRNWMTAFVFIVILVIVSFSYVMFVIVHRPLKRLSDAFLAMESGSFDVEIRSRTSDEFRDIYARFNRMASTIRRLIKETYEQKILLQQAELKQLQSKINPHFLYNTFFSIATMAKAEGSDTTSDLALKMGRYFRYVMKHASERVPLADELEYATLYAEIQEIRFGNRLRITFEPPPIVNAYTPAFTIQPLIENAIEHGLADKKSGGWVRIGFRAAQSALTIFVEDNGGRLTQEHVRELSDNLRRSENDALSNIAKRLKMSFGEPDSVRFYLGEENGLRVEIIIPIINPIVNED